MKTNIMVVGLILVLIATVPADTFRHKESGEVFYGFQTHKRSGGKLLVYNSDQQQTQTIEESQYEIALDSKGRRDIVIRVPIREPEILLSEVISARIAKIIVDASDNGPQFIVVEIDSPGGRGEYMRQIASAIEQTRHCPVIAYVSGGDYGGAFSAAAVIALACDAVYIAPTASIGAVGPIQGATTKEQYAAYLNLYSPDLLAVYSGYAMGLVKKDELRLVARALVDKSVSVIEVVDAATNKTVFVERDNRQPTQTIVRTLAEGIPAGEASVPVDSAPGVQPAAVIGRALNLNAAEALRIGMADKEAASLKEIAATRGLKDVQFTNAPDIGPTVRQFTAAQRNLSQNIMTINQLEDYASRLDQQVIQVESQIRTGTVTREVGLATLRRRSPVTLPEPYDLYYGAGTGGTTVTTRERTPSDQSGARPRRQMAQSERYITEQPNVSLEVLRTEQVNVLRNLTVEYRRTINLARRWPGALPPGLSVQTLEQNMDSAQVLLDNILRYSMQSYPQTPMQTAPAQRGRR